MIPYLLNVRSKEGVASSQFYTTNEGSLNLLWKLSCFNLIEVEYDPEVDREMNRTRYKMIDDKFEMGTLYSIPEEDHKMFGLLNGTELLLLANEGIKDHFEIFIFQNQWTNSLTIYSLYLNGYLDKLLEISKSNAIEWDESHWDLLNG